MFSRPEKVPPPPANGWGWRSIYVLLGAAAWLAWFANPQWGTPWVRVGMILYFVLLGLNVVWSGLFYWMARPGAAFAAVLVQGLVTLAALVLFWKIWILPGALLVPVMMWTGFLAIRNLAWWRQGKQLGPLAPPAAVPPSGLAA
jgi:translocator protein